MGGQEVVASYSLQGGQLSVYSCDPDLISLNFNLKSFAMYNNGEPLAFGPPNRPMFNCQFTSEKTNKSGQSFGNVQHRC